MSNDKAQIMKRMQILFNMDDLKIMWYARKGEVSPIRVFGIRREDFDHKPYVDFEGFQVLIRELNNSSVPADEGWVQESEWVHERWIHLTEDAAKADWEIKKYEE